MRRIQDEGVQKFGAEENIWTYKEEVQTVENFIMESINKYYSCDQIKGDEINIAYGTYGGET
jgi:hypothetical protein